MRVVAAGKAAGPMLRPCLDADLMVARGLVITTHSTASAPRRSPRRPSGADRGERGGRRAALDLARGAAADESLLVLLSGGASALMSAPVEGLSLEDKMATTKLLLEAARRSTS